MEPEEIRLSPMPKTWILDLDGTLVVHTLRFLKENRVRYDHIIFDAGEAERIMINDNKPDGLVTAYAVSTKRDRFCRTRFVTDQNLGTIYD